jgi:membrane protein DedA with SNARE-associated domain
VHYFHVSSLNEDRAFWQWQSTSAMRRSHRKSPVAKVRVMRHETRLMLHEITESLITWSLHLVNDWGYLGVIILMAMESSIFPVPSEVVVPPAAIIAASNGSMTLTGVVLAGTFGSWLGSAITYWIALWMGRPFVEKFGKFFFVPPDKLERAERFMRRYESGGIFFARLMPVIRHLISIPAGIIRMGFIKFSVLTTVGAGIWCSVLAWLGGKVGSHLQAEGKDPLHDGAALIAAVKHESHLVIGVVILIAVLYFVMLKLTAPKSET